MFSTRAAYTGGFPERPDNELAPMLMTAARINQDLKSADADDLRADCGEISGIL